jgi:hypothetical protein
MTVPERDACLICTLLRSLNTQRLPRLFALQARLDQGERLTPDDIGYLQRSMADTLRIKSLCERNAGLALLCAKVAALYRDITMKALANEVTTQG